MPNAFVDTNVLIYAADESKSDERETRIARELLRQRGLQLRTIAKPAAFDCHPGHLFWQTVEPQD